MRRINQRMVAPRVPASSCHLGGIRKKGQAHSLLLAGTVLLVGGFSATLGTRASHAMDATGVTGIVLDNFTTTTQGDDITLTSDAENVFTITEAMGRRPLTDSSDPGSLGPNLFHSFFDFGLSAGETALFTQAITDGTDPISNVISRVTGGRPSAIDGTIKSEIAGADFWFVNPAGVVFGEQSSIDVSGSFNASAGDFIVLEDGTTIDALASDPLLTVSNPTNFGFFSPTSGGTLSFNGTQLRGAASSSLPDTYRSLNFHARDIVVDEATSILTNANSSARGDITLTASNTLDIEGTLTTTARGNRAAGNIALSAHDLVISSTDLGSTSEGRGSSGSITIDTTGTVDISDSRLEVSSNQTNGGAAGSVLVNSDGDITTSNSALVAMTTSNRQITDADGNQIRPDVVLRSGGDITMTDSTALSTTFGEANGGSVILEGQDILIVGDLEVVSKTDPDLGLGRALNASSKALLDNGGDAGDVIVRGVNIQLNDGARATAITAAGGNAGDVLIVAEDTFSTNVGIATTSDQVFISSANQGSTNYDPDERGASGDVTIRAGRRIDLNNTRLNVQRRSDRPEFNDTPSTMILSVDDGTLRLNRVNAFTSTTGDNDAGELSLSAKDVDLTRTTLSSFTNGRGHSGSVIIEASESITADRLRAEAEAGRGNRGAAGDISLNSQGSIDLLNSEIVAGTQSNLTNRDSDGNVLRANISIMADEDITLTDSAIVASTLARADAGDIAISGRDVTISGSIEANSRFAQRGVRPLLGQGVEASTKLQSANGGDGGNVSILADNLILNNGAQVLSTTDGSGNAGNVRIEATEAITSNRGVTITEENRDDLRVAISSANLPVDSPDDKPELGASGNVSITAGTLLDLNNTEIFAIRRSSRPDNTTASNIDLTVTNGDLLANDVSVSNSTRGANDGGVLTASARNIQLTDSSIFSFTSGVGNSGSANLIATQDITFTNASLIAQSSNSSKGAAGSISINAGGSLSATDSELVASTQSDRVILDENGNEITPSVSISTAGDTTLIRSAVLASATGEAGAGSISITGDTVTVEGKRAVTSIFGDNPELGEGISASTFGKTVDAGNAGNVTITANNLRLERQASITSNTGGPGNAGDININVTNEFTSNRVSANEENEDGESIQVVISSTNLEESEVAERDTMGESGNIIITAGSLVELNATQINTLRRSNNPDNNNSSRIDITVTDGDLNAQGGFIASSTLGNNNAGSLNLEANNVNVSNGRLSSFTRGRGNSGSINLTARNAITITDLEILAQSASATRGAAGSVALNAQGDIEVNNSAIVAATETNRIRRRNGQVIRPSVEIATAGNVTINDSAVLASTVARSAAGSIDITGDHITINGTKQVNSLFGANADLGTGISASTLSEAANAGDAGNVTLIANNLSLMNGARVTSNTGGGGNAGDINITIANDIYSNQNLTAADAEERADTRVEISSANLAVQDPDDKFDLGASGTVTLTAGNLIDLNNTKISALRRSSNSANTDPSEVRLVVADGDLIGRDIELTSATRGANEGGSVDIDARNIDLQNSQLTSFTTGEGNSGSVRVNTANDFIGDNVTIGVESGNRTKGAAGAVTVTTGRDLTLVNSAVVAATQSNRIIRNDDGTERAPEVVINSAGAVTLVDSAVLTTTVGRAAAGSISITADSLTVEGSRSVTSGFGGRPDLGAGISASTLGADPLAGDAGSVTLAANTIELNDGASITSTTDGAGNAGNIRIEAAERLVANRPTASANQTAAASTAQPQNEELALVVISSANLPVDSPDDKPGLGASGTVVVTAGELIDVTNTEISALRRSSNPDNQTPSTVEITVTNGDLIADRLTASSSTRGANNAGSVTTRANNITLTDSQMQSFTTGEGNSGSIIFEAQGNIASSGSRFGVESGNTSKGAAGEISITAGGDIDFTDTIAVGATQSNREILDENGNQRVPRVDITAGGAIALTDSAVLTTTVGRADAGSISIQGDHISVSGKGSFQSSFGARPELGSGISASTLGTIDDAGHAGSVTLVADTIELSNGASITSRTGGSGNAGDIQVQARSQLLANVGQSFTDETLLDNRVLVSSSNLTVNSPDEKFGLGASGNVTVSAGNLIDLNNAEISASRRSSNEANLSTSEVNISVASGDLRASDIEFSSATSGANNGGSLQISADNIEIESGVLSAFTTGRGNSGSVLINASGALSGNDLAIEVESSNGSKGAAGRVEIITGGALTLDESRVVAATQSNRNILDADGNTLIPSVDITSGGPVTLTNSAVLASALGNAPAGSITIAAPTISVEGSRDVVSRLRRASFLGSGVSASANASGEAGTVSLLATDQLSLSNARVASQSLGDGAAGEIELTGEMIAITNGSEVLASTQGSAAGGQVTITGTTVELSGANTRVSSNATNTGTGGKVDINVTDLFLTSGARIETLAEGEGDSGNITINASGDVVLETSDNTIFDNRSALLSESSTSQGGSITANVAGELRVNNSRIESSVNGEDGTGGDINITPQALFLTSGQILAQAQQGSGGAINIGRGGNSNTPAAPADDGLFLIDSNSIINADSDAGTNGVVAVDSPDINANAVIAEPDARIVATPQLNDSLCSAEAADRSSLVLVNEGGVPPAPDAYLGAQLETSSSQNKNDTALAPGTSNKLTTKSDVSTPESGYLGVAAGCTIGGE